MENFPSNSQVPRPKDGEKAEEKRVERVVEGKVTRRKKPMGTKFRELFFGDGQTGVMDYVFGEVLVPAMKDMITDAVSQGIERMVFGENRPNRRRPSSSGGAFGGTNTGYTNYNRYSSPQRQDRPMSRRARGSHDFDEIILGSRAEAQDVIDSLFDLVKRYESASIRDLYEMVGVEFHHTDEKWGWTDLSNAGVRRISNGYLLDLPKAEPLD